MIRISEIDSNVAFDTFKIMHVLERSLKWLFDVHRGPIPLSLYNTIFFFPLKTDIDYFN